MEYLEAVLIKRIRPDSVPGNLVHLLEEAERTVKRHAAMCSASDGKDPDQLALSLPALSVLERERVNSVLLAHLALVCGKLYCWGGPGKPRAPIKPIEVVPAVSGMDVTVGAKPQHAPLMWETTS